MSERNKDLITKMVVFVIISVLFVITLCVSFMPLRKNGSQNEQNKTGSEQGGLVLSEQEEKGIALMHCRASGERSYAYGNGAAG